MGKISPPAIVWCVVAWTLTCGVTAGARAWEPTAAAVQEAVKGGDFAGFLAAAADWLAARTPDAVDEPALSRLLDDPLFADTVTRHRMIAAAKPDALAAFVKTAAANREFLSWLLGTTQAMNLYLEGSTPNGNDHVAALGVLRDIVVADADARHGMHLRLALATALVHARQHRAFGTGVPIDPVKRYLHFKQAQTAAELVPMFDDLTVWEYAKVVDCAASDDDLAWARAMLRTMRPELVREARFIAMVSEVQYTSAKWGPPPHTFATVLNGGGKCGPRAWFGRMINQAFGVPVWGVKQPGHAAVGFLGDQGWKVKLGRGWEHSTWDGMNGKAFLEIVAARDHATDFSRAERLRWLADVLEPKERAVAVKAVADGIRRKPGGPVTTHRLRPRTYPAPEAEERPATIPGLQHLLASDFSTSHQARVVPSFDRGKQVYFQKNSEGWAEYRVNIPAQETYGVTIGHAVANGTCRVRIYVGDTRIGWMHLNNTKGLWGKTKEWDFVLPKTDTVRFVFPPQRGVAVKWIELKAKGDARPTAQDDEPTAVPASDEDDPRDPSTADGDT